MAGSSGVVHRRHVFCSHVSVHVVLGGLPDALHGESVLVSSSTPWTASVEELEPEPPAWWQCGQPMHLTMAAVAEHVAVQKGIAIVAAEAAGDEPATAGDGAGDGASDDNPVELCTKRRKTHMPLEVKEWFCSLARVKPNWTMSQCHRFAKRALPPFLEHAHIGHPPSQVVLAEHFRYRSWPPRAPWNPQLPQTWQTLCPASAAECAVAQECWQNSSTHTWNHQESVTASPLASPENSCDHLDTP